MNVGKCQVLSIPIHSIYPTLVHIISFLLFHFELRKQKQSVRCFPHVASLCTASVQRHVAEPPGERPQHVFGGFGYGTSWALSLHAGPYGEWYERNRTCALLYVQLYVQQPVSGALCCGVQATFVEINTVVGYKHSVASVFRSCSIIDHTL